MENTRYNNLVERRKAKRCEYLTKMDYIIEGRREDNYSQLYSMNISRDGILLFGYCKICPGDRIDLTFRAPFYGYRKITLFGTVVWIVDKKRSYIKHIGVRFNRNIFQGKIEDFVEDVNSGYYCN